MSDLRFSKCDATEQPPGGLSGVAPAPKEGERWRLFVALPVDEQVRAALEREQERLTRDGVPFRWVRLEALHLTLAFLGSTPVEMIEPIGNVIDAAAARSRPMRLEAGGLGYFPNAHRPRVLWAGLHGDLDALKSLQENLDGRLRALGIELERRAFHPHLTLGRAKESRRPAPLANREDHASQRFGTWTASSLSLIRSQLGRSGSAYTALHTAKLGAPPTLPQ